MFILITARSDGLYVRTSFSRKERLNNRRSMPKVLTKRKPLLNAGFVEEDNIVAQPEELPPIIIDEGPSESCF